MKRFWIPWRKKEIYFAVWAMLLALCMPANAQHAKKAPRIAYLSQLSPSADSVRTEAFRQGLRDLGYIEGQNIALEWRYVEGKLNLLPEVVAQLLDLKVDIIVVGGATAASEAKKATATTPIVMAQGSDPVLLGLVASLAKPGGNVTGLTHLAPDLGGKRLELLTETIPKLSRVAVLWNPGNPGSEEIWKESQRPARALGLQLHSMEVSSADQLESAFRGAVKAPSAGLAVTLSALITSNRKRIADLAIKHRLPAIYERREFAESGGLMSYGADQEEPYRRVAVFVDKFSTAPSPPTFQSSSRPSSNWSSTSKQPSRSA